VQVATKLRAIRRALDQEEQITKGDEVVFLCPKCKHRKPKLSVNLKIDWFHCWVCDWKGKNLVPLLRLRGNTPELREYMDEMDDRPKELAPRVYDRPSLPQGFRSLSRPSRSPYFTAAMAYLGSRGLGTDDILRWKLGYCDEGDYRGRIIIPSFDEHGELNFVVGRSYYGDPRPFKHENICKDIVWNDYMVDWSRPVVVTEGPFDAFKAEDNVVALQGSIMGHELFRRIVSTGADVQFAMDTDAFKKQLNIIQRLLRFGVVCWYVNLLGKKDVGAMTKEEFQQAKSRATPVRSDLDLLRLRVMA
jgi:hypothetical protein